MRIQRILIFVKIMWLASTTSQKSRIFGNPINLHQILKISSQLNITCMHSACGFAFSSEVS